MSGESDWERMQNEFVDWFKSPDTTDEERTLYVMELDLLMDTKKPGSPFDRPSTQE